MAATGCSLLCLRTLEIVWSTRDSPCIFGNIWIAKEWNTTNWQDCKRNMNIGWKRQIIVLFSRGIVLQIIYNFIIVNTRHRFSVALFAFEFRPFRYWAIEHRWKVCAKGKLPAIECAVEIFEHSRVHIAQNRKYEKHRHSDVSTLLGNFEEYSKCFYWQNILKSH